MVLSFNTKSAVPLRAPADVMRLKRLGASFQTRISFARRLIRRMHREKWRVERTLFDLNYDGFGTAIYVVTTPECCYSLVCFSHHLDPEERTDRVIAKAWDATFSLFQGVPTDADISRLGEETPKQEAGRFKPSELVLSRANKSLRIFESVVNNLAEGNQPDLDKLNSVGYLMRTTAVYANGKFGMADRTCYADQSVLASPFQAEMLTVYLIRGFTHDLVEHMAFLRAPEGASKLDRAFKRHLGVGNATGLGMAPFLISHPHLIHNWFFARETGLSRIRSIRVVPPDRQVHFRDLLERAKQHIEEWIASDSTQNLRNAALLEDLQLLKKWTAEGAEIFSETNPWNALFRRAECAISIEGQELLLSLLFEPYPELIDELAEGLQVDRELPFDPSITVQEMKSLIERCYSWALEFDFTNPRESEYFWYYSEEKEEPRRGERRKEVGADKEMKIAVAQEIQLFYSALQKESDDKNLATFLTRNAGFRHVARRVQIGARYLYAEIQDNLISDSCKPIDILRGKLAFFGASKFDPKSDLWTRITMYQGAPLTDELDSDNADDWSFPTKPVVRNCTSP
tara:strand:+ start:1068 stop:2783 length:1716 start_codon:yes stop_codon:yes gene_type:complete